MLTRLCMYFQAGAPYFITKEDLKVVAPQWSSFTRKVRNDPTAFNLTGDMHTRAHGDKPWIAEMCASLNVARAIYTVQ